MAVIIKTKDPDWLLSDIYEVIDMGKTPKWNRTEKGHIVPTSRIWKDSVFFVPKVFSDDSELYFDFISTRKIEYVAPRIYVMVHCRFVEMVLSNFDLHFELVSVTTP